MFSKFRQIGKNQSAINELCERLDRIDGNVSRIESKVNVLKKQITDIDVNSRGVYTLSNDLEEIQNKLNKIKDVL